MDYHTTNNPIVQVVTAAILGIPAITHAVLAEASVTDFEWVGSITQISAFGLVAWIVWYMFSSWLPRIQDDQAKQLDAQREAHVEAMHELATSHCEAITKMTEAFSENLKQQRVDLLAMRAYCKAATPNHD